MDHEAVPIVRLFIKNQTKTVVEQGSCLFTKSEYDTATIFLILLFHYLLLIANNPTVNKIPNKNSNFPVLTRV